MLNPRVFNAICHQWGRPQVDLFATRYNAQLTTFVSPVPDPLAYAVDAMVTPWAGMWAYAYPPPALLPLVLEKVADETVRLVLIAPFWPKRPWFPRLLELLVEPPWELPQWPDLVHQGRLLHARPGMFHLHAWLLSSDRCEHKAFLAKLPLALLSHTAPVLSSSTKPSGPGSAIGVLHDRLITSKFLPI